MTGEGAISFKYEEVSAFHGGLAKVLRKNRTFYIDRSGVEYVR